MMKKMLTDRRGIAIEMAILMTVICFAISTIVLSTALLQHEKKVRAEERLEENVILEKIGEEFVSNKGTKQPTDNDEYVYVFSTGVLEVYKKGENGNPTGDCLLKIVIEGNQITEWKKG